MNKTTTINTETGEIVEERPGPDAVVAVEHNPVANITPDALEKHLMETKTTLGYTDEHDAEGRMIARTYGSDTNHPNSWRSEYDSAGRHIARTYGCDPKHPNSWRDEYDSAGCMIACTWGGDPKNPNSWRSEFDAAGRCIARTWRGDPKHPNSWRGEDYLLIK